MRRPAIVLLMLGFLLAAGAPALADDGATDTEEGSRHLDIKGVSNEADDEYVTYRIETYDSYDNVDDFSYFRWYFDTNGDGHFVDMCIRLEAVGDGRLRAMFFPDCGQESWSTAEATKINDRTLEIKFPTRDFVVGGGVKPGEPFEYTVASEDIEGKTDKIPDRGSIAHSALPEPAQLFVTAAPEDGGGGAEGRDAAAEAAAEREGEGGIPLLSDLADAIDDVPTGLLLLAILAAFGIVLGTVLVLRNQRRAPVIENLDNDRPEAAAGESSGPAGVDTTAPLPSPGPWGWTDQDGDTHRVHSPDT